MVNRIVLSLFLAVAVTFFVIAGNVLSEEKDNGALTQKPQINPQTVSISASQPDNDLAKINAELIKIAKEQIEKSQNQFDKSLNVLDKSISGINQSISIFNSGLNWYKWIVAIVSGLVVVILAILGFFGFKSYGDFKKKYDEAINKFEDIKKNADFIDKMRTQVETSYNIVTSIENSMVNVKIDSDKKPPAETDKHNAEQFTENADFLKTFGYKPENPEFYFALGNSFYLQGKYQEAIDAYDKAIALNPNLAEAWSNKGNALFRQDKFNDALEAYDKAIAINPNDKISFVNKGLVFIRLSKDQEAIKMFDEAISIDSNYAEAYGNRACAYALLKEKDKMIADLKQAVKLNPELKEKSKKDVFFQKYWDDPDFKKVVE